jgi:hypothetical protein
MLLALSAQAQTMPVITEADMARARRAQPTITDQDIERARTAHGVPQTWNVCPTQRDQELMRSRSPKPKRLWTSKRCPKPTPCS